MVLVTLVLAAFLSPILLVVAILVLLASMVGLLIRLVLHRPWTTWGLAAVASFVLTFIFVLSGVSNAVYDPASQEQAAGLEKAEEPPKTARESATESEEKAEPKEPEPQDKVAEQCRSDVRIG